MTSDIAKLILRVSVGIMILFHGFDKVINGIDGIKQLTVSAGFLEFLAYSVFIGEVIVPIFILLGAYARAASLVLAFNMAVAIFLAHGNAMFLLGKHGAPVFELPFLYLVMSILIFMLGSGKYAINNK